MNIILNMQVSETTSPSTQLSNLLLGFLVLVSYLCTISITVHMALWLEVQQCVYHLIFSENIYMNLISSSMIQLFPLNNGQDIIHCHDWSSAPVAWLFKEHYAHYGPSKARVVFTIHNLEFGVHFIEKAMAHSDKATTVSVGYALNLSILLTLCST